MRARRAQPIRTAAPPNRPNAGRIPYVSPQDPLRPQVSAPHHRIGPRLRSDIRRRVARPSGSYSAPPECRPHPPAHPTVAPPVRAPTVPAATPPCQAAGPDPHAMDIRRDMVPARRGSANRPSSPVTKPRTSVAAVRGGHRQQAAPRARPDIPRREYRGRRFDRTFPVTHMGPGRPVHGIRTFPMHANRRERRTTHKPPRIRTRNPGRTPFDSAYARTNHGGHVGTPEPHHGLRPDPPPMAP